MSTLHVYNLLRHHTKDMTFLQTPVLLLLTNTKTITNNFQ